MKKLFLVTAVTAALTGCIAEDNVSDRPVSLGNSSSFLTLTGASGVVAETDDVLTASVSDKNGEPTELTYVWKADQVEIPGAGSGNTYTVTLADEGKRISANVAFIDLAGNDEIASANVPVRGNQDGYVVFRGKPVVGEVIKAKVVDADGTTTALADSSIIFNWTGQGVTNDTSSDEYTVVAGDIGSPITLQIVYTDDRNFAEPAVGEIGPVTQDPVTYDSNSAHLIDTNPVKSDNGELRFKLADFDVDNIDSGRITAKLQLQEDADTAVDQGNLDNKIYLTLWSGGSTSNAGAVVDLSLSGSNDSDSTVRASTAGAVSYRITDPTDSSNYPLVNDGVDTLTWTAGEEIDILVSWTLEDWTFSLDGGFTEFGPFDRVSSGADPVDAIAFKLGTSSKVSTYELFIDDIVIYNGAEEVFRDGFEDYALDQDLVGNPYNSNSHEATVVTNTWGD